MSLLAKIKSYCETNNITAAQLSKANQRQVANASSCECFEFNNR